MFDLLKVVKAAEEFYDAPLSPTAEDAFRDAIAFYKKQQDLAPKSTAIFLQSLLMLWHEAYEIKGIVTAQDFPDWAGKTKDLLISFGLAWDLETQDYKLP